MFDVLKATLFPKMYIHKDYDFHYVPVIVKSLKANLRPLSSLHFHSQVDISSTISS